MFNWKKRATRLEQENQLLAQLFRHPGHVVEFHDRLGDLRRQLEVRLADECDLDALQLVYDNLTDSKEDGTRFIYVYRRGDRSDIWDTGTYVTCNLYLEEGVLVMCGADQQRYYYRHFMLWLAEDYDKRIHPVALSEPDDFVFLNQKNEKGEFRWSQPWS